MNMLIDPVAPETDALKEPFSLVYIPSRAKHFNKLSHCDVFCWSQEVPHDFANLKRSVEVVDVIGEDKEYFLASA